MYPARRSQVWMVLFSMMLFFHAVPETAQSQSMITKKKIQEMMEAMDTAINEKNADGVVQFMSPDVSIDVLLKNAEGHQSIHLERETYRQHLRDAFQTVDDYVFSRSTLNIEIKPGGKSATVVTNLIEKITVRGTILRTVTREVSVFEVIGSDILITSIQSVSSVEEEGGSRI